MSPNPNNYYTYPRQYFTDSVGRGFSDKHWADFAQAMDKYALSYMNTLEKVLDKENV
jgi:hypothetical protein